MSAPASICVDIISDVVCPWCFIGKRRLEKAIQGFRQVHPGSQVKVRWHPFYLNPTIRTTVDKYEYYTQKFGADRVPQLTQSMQQTAAQEGINLRFGGLTGPTKDAHRLMTLAKSDEALQNKVSEELMHQYFEKNNDITSRETLADVGTRLGVFADKEKANQFFASSEISNDVDDEVQVAQDIGVSGVPFFIIRNDAKDGPQGERDVPAYTISGAQEPKTLQAVLEKVLSSDGSSNQANHEPVAAATC